MCFTLKRALKSPSLPPDRETNPFVCEDSNNDHLANQLLPISFNSCDSKMGTQCRIGRVFHPYGLITVVLSFAIKMQSITSKA